MDARAFRFCKPEPGSYALTYTPSSVNSSHFSLFLVLTLARAQSLRKRCSRDLSACIVGPTYYEDLSAVSQNSCEADQPANALHRPSPHSSYLNIMGAWSLGLFESNHDEHVVDELDLAARLLVDDFFMRAVYQAALESGEAQPGKAYKKVIGKKVSGEEVYVILDANFATSLYAKAGASPGYTRYRIENCPSLFDPKDGSELQRLIKKYTMAMRANRLLTSHSTIPTEPHIRR